jgi:YbbR domain-containing protein
MFDRLFARWPLKLFALGLAFATWLAVTGENRVIQFFEVPLDPLGISVDDDLLVTSASTSTVRVRVRGPESLVRGIDPLRLAFHVDLRGAGAGERSILLTPDLLAGIPKELETWIEPERIAVRLDPKLRRSLTVVPLFMGQPPQGYQLYDFHVVPEQMDVEGPEASVRPLTRLRTEPIRLDHEQQPFAVRVPAVPDSPEVRLVDRTQPLVRVEIDQSPEEATYTVPVRLRRRESGAQVEPAAVSVTLSGPPRLLRRIGPERVRAVADVGALAAGSRAHNVPLRVEVTDLEPQDRARVTVKSVSRREVVVRLPDRSGAS